MTNYEKMKAMTVEEMAHKMANQCYGCGRCPAIKCCDINDTLSCEETYEKWLESEVEEDG